MAFLESSDLHAGSGEIAVLRGVSMEVEERQTVALLGANGAGKTTMLRALFGLIPASRGTVRFDGEVLGATPTHEIVERGLVMVPEGRGMFPFMTVEENLELGSYTPRARAARRRSLDFVFDLLPRLAERRRQLAGSLSGGEQQMCAIGRGLMAVPRLMVLDEPSVGLAPKIVDEMFALLRRLQQEGIAILLVEQHVRRALQLSSTGFVLESGRIGVAGASAALLDDPAVKKAYLGQ